MKHEGGTCMDQGRRGRVMWLEPNWAMEIVSRLGWDELGMGIWSAGARRGREGVE